jgi:lincosamide nucleotidyltransferase A/C/D/E
MNRAAALRLRAGPLGYDSAVVKPGSTARAEAADVIEILDALDAAGVASWLDGGWGVDALLGQQTRAHQDVDLVVELKDVATMRATLDASGFELIEGVPESNFVLRDGRGREIDVHPVRFDAAGNGIYRMEDGDDWIYAAAGFAGRGSIAGRRVSCLTPEMQMVGHAGGYAPHETDFHDMRLLHERFGTPLLGPYAEADPPTG